MQTSRRDTSFLKSLAKKPEGFYTAMLWKRINSKEELSGRKIVTTNLQG